MYLCRYTLDRSTRGYKEVENLQYKKAHKAPSDPNADISFKNSCYVYCQD